LGQFWTESEVEIYPENWETVSVFSQMSTQWRPAFSGVIGLDYSVLFRLMDNLQLSKSEWEQMFNDIRIMESVALETIRQ